MVACHVVVAILTRSRIGFGFDFSPLFDGDGPPPFTTFLGLLVANVFIFFKRGFSRLTILSCFFVHS